MPKTYLFDTPNLTITIGAISPSKDCVTLYINEHSAKETIMCEFTKDDLVRLKTAIEDLIHEFP